MVYDAERLYQIRQRVSGISSTCMHQAYSNKRVTCYRETLAILRYILVEVDYFTKWIKVIPLVNMDQEAIINFILKHNIYRFGIPETITTDQWSIFTGRKMQEFASEVGIKLLTSTPYYTKANVQVKATNKITISLIKKHARAEANKLAQEIGPSFV